MVLTSGNAPYEYAVRTLPFRVPNPTIGTSAIGESGILIEQAQFVITAELRKFLRLANSHTLPSFHIFVNPVITPSGPFEPKTNGSTLGNLINPEGLIFVDPIRETRTALDSLFIQYSNDSNFTNQEHRADWLQNAYPKSPSGFYTALGTTGHYYHRIPSEIGLILYNSGEVLGSSGIFFDIDFGEVMFNPYPYMSTTAALNAHDRLSNGSINIYDVVGGPIWPSFQKTTGPFTGTNGREPSNDVGLSQSITGHIGSGKIRVDGYVLLPSSTYMIGNVFPFPDTFTHFANGIRAFGAAGNLPTSRVYLTPHAVSSGIYRMVAKNFRVNVPTTAVESGTISIWPRAGSQYYLTAQNFSNPFTTTDATYNNGYHVFDETLWITDRTFVSANIPSGLTILSPWTGHQLWLRYAEQASGTLGGVWGDHTGLERIAANNIFRSHNKSISETVSPFLQTYTLHKYDDMLNYIGDFTSDGNPNTTIGIGGQVKVTDVFYDGSSYFFLGAAGSGMTQLDSGFNYVSSWVVESDLGFPAFSGTGSRAFFGNGKYFFYAPTQGGDNVGGLNMRSSGIIEFAFSTRNRVDLVDIKYVRAENVFTNHLPLTWRFDDIIEVISSPQLTPGIWAIISILFLGDIFPSSYLARLTERLDYWEVSAIMKLNHGSAADLLGGPGTVDILYMGI